MMRGRKIFSPVDVAILEKISELKITDDQKNIARKNFHNPTLQNRGRLYLCRIDVPSECLYYKNVEITRIPNCNQCEKLATIRFSPNGKYNVCEECFNTRKKSFDKIIMSENNLGVLNNIIYSYLFTRNEGVMNYQELRKYNNHLSIDVEMVEEYEMSIHNRDFIDDKFFITQEISWDGIELYLEYTEDTPGDKNSATIRTIIFLENAKIRVEKYGLVGRIYSPTHIDLGKVVQYFKNRPGYEWIATIRVYY